MVGVNVSPPSPTPPTRASAASAAAGAASTQLSSLSVSLLQDLTRPELGQPGRRALLEVLAASVRHAQGVSARLQLADAQELLLTVLPRQRLMHCAWSLNRLLATDLSRWQVLEVTAATVRPPTPLFGLAQEPIAPPFATLAPLLWAVALAGVRGALLPELAGQAAYRVAPGVNLSGLYMPGPMLACVGLLRRETCSRRTLAACHDIGTERATRLLNALYLQSALIVSRSHPAATNLGWAGYGQAPDDSAQAQLS